MTCGRPTPSSSVMSSGRLGTEPVDQAVGDLGGDDLVPQAMTRDGFGLLLLHRLGEGGHQLVFHGRIVGQLQLFGRVLQGHFRHRQDHRQLRPGQAAAVGTAAKQDVAAFKALDLAIEPAGDSSISMDRTKPGMPAGPRDSGNRQAPGLQPIVLEHQLGNLVGHFRQQLVAGLFLQPPLAHLAVQRDLDVDLIVRTIDAGRIVDEVGVDPAADRSRTRCARPG